MRQNKNHQRKIHKDNQAVKAEKIHRKKIIVENIKSEMKAEEKKSFIKRLINKLKLKK